MEVDYNPLCLQAHPYAVVLTHPDTPIKHDTYSIRPPRLRIHTRGDAVWTRWWRTTLLVQCPSARPMPTMNDRTLHTSTSYLQLALTLGLKISKAFLNTIHQNNDNFQLANIALRSVRAGSYIITHQKKNNSPILTNHVISTDEGHAYAMLAILEGPIRTQLRTLICIQGTIHSQVVHITINPHSRSILGRTHHHLFAASGTQELAPKSPSQDTTRRRASLAAERISSYGPQCSYVTLTP
jgi:hypothetical protein